MGGSALFVRFDWFVSIDDLIADTFLRSISGYKVLPWTSSRVETKITWSSNAFFGCDSVTGALTNQEQVQWTHRRTTFSRSPAVLPSLLSNVRFRAGPKQAYLGILLALGLIDRKKGGR